MKNKGITVKELAILAYKEVEKGNGDKHVLISDDDEGNGFHTLFYGFQGDSKFMKELKDYGMFHDNNIPSEVIILG